MKRVLISTLGSHGDLLPFIALAQKFASHGHEPILYTNPFFRECVEATGISFVPVGTVEQFTSTLAWADANATQNPLRAFRPITAELSARCRDY